MESSILHTVRQAAALRQKWAQGKEPSFLGWITMLDPAVAEMEVEWGYDGLLIDTEHATFDPPALRSALMAFRGADCVPLVRVGDNDIYLIKTALDLGAMGVLVPLIQNADDARAAVQYCRYPPQGVRGISPRRASNYFNDADAYIAEANRSILVMVQIECRSAYENLDAILQVEGIDCFLIGPADLSASLGHVWDLSHPEVIAAMEDIIRRCRRAGRSAAVAAGAEVAQIQHWLDAGANVLSCGSDLGFIRAGFNAFKAEMQAAGLPFART
ncbi:MAG: HpcH/HpaI aldolase family protein [Chloroflexota bacterium]